MKKILLLLILVPITLFGDIVGEYRLTGINIVDYDFCRQNTDIVVTEKSGFDSTPLTVYTIQQGENIDYDARDPYPLFALNAAGVDLWVYFAEDGTATVLEGSTYPAESVGEGCFTEEVVLPIQEDFSYSVNSNSNEYIQNIEIYQNEIKKFSKLEIRFILVAFFIQLFIFFVSQYFEFTIDTVRGRKK